MTAIALVVALALLAALAIMQILAASGLPLGHFGWGGQHRVLTRGLRVASAASVLVYAGLAALLLSRAGVLPAGDSTAVIVLTWVVFAFFAASVRSPAERWTMAPTSLLLAAATLVIALGGG